MTIREGANASYVGPRVGGLEIGDRCFVLADESAHCHVRWLTGALTGSYDSVLHEDLVADLPPARFEDEFTFESFSNRIVNVACREVLSRRGEKALLRSLDQEGHLGGLRVFASTLVGQMRQAIQDDPSWMEVRADLADDALSFERYALRHFLLGALEEAERDGPVQHQEES